jgi:hypothetical protein
VGLLITTMQLRLTPSRMRVFRPTMLLPPYPEVATTLTKLPLVLPPICPADLYSSKNCAVGLSGSEHPRILSLEGGNLGPLPTALVFRTVSLERRNDATGQQGDRRDLCNDVRDVGVREHRSAGMAPKDSTRRGWGP